MASACGEVARRTGSPDSLMRQQVLYRADSRLDPTTLDDIRPRRQPVQGSGFSPLGMKPGGPGQPGAAVVGAAEHEGPAVALGAEPDAGQAVGLVVHHELAPAVGDI